jgi:hypothetical protein
MADKAGDKFTSGGYSYVLDHGPKGNLRPYYKGKSKSGGSGVGGELVVLLVKSLVPVAVGAGCCLYEWWTKRGKGRDAK